MALSTGRRVHGSPYTMQLHRVPHESYTMNHLKEFVWGSIHVGHDWNQPIVFDFPTPFQHIHVTLPNPDHNPIIDFERVAFGHSRG